MSNWKRLSFLLTVQLTGLVAGATPTCSGPALQVPSSCHTQTRGNQIIEEVTYTFTRSRTASNPVASTPRDSPLDAHRQTQVASSLNNAFSASKVPAAHGVSLPAVSTQEVSGQLNSPASLNHAASTLKPVAASELAPSAAQSSSLMSTPAPAQTSSVITSGSITIVPVYQATDYPEYSSITDPITTTTTDGGHHPIPLVIWPPGRSWKCILNCGGSGDTNAVVVPLPIEPPPGPASPGNPGGPKDPKDPKDPSTGDPSTSSSTTTTSQSSQEPLLAAMETPIYDDFVIVTADGAKAAIDNLRSRRNSASSAALAQSTLSSQPSASSDPPLLQPPSKSSSSSLAAASQSKSKPASTTSPAQESTSESSTSKTSTGKTSTSSATHSELTPTPTPTPRKNDGSTTCQMIWKDDMVEEKGKQHDWMYKIILSGSWADEDSFHNKINDCTHGGELKSWTWKKQGDESYMAAFDLTKWPKGNEDCVADAITKQGSFGADEVTCPDASNQHVDSQLVTDLTRKSMKDAPL